MTEPGGPEHFARLAAAMGKPPVWSGSWNDLHLQVLRLAPGGWSHPAGAFVRLTIPLGDEGRVCRRLPGERNAWVSGLKRPGTVSVTPARTEGDWVWLDPSHFGLLFLPDSLMRDAADEVVARADAVSLQPVLAAPDPVPPAVFSTLLSEIGARGRQSRLLISSAALFLARHVLVRYGAPRHEPVTGVGRDPRRFARVLDAIEGELARDWSVHELAREAGLSPFRFAHAFKACIGASPRSFVQTRRLAHARRMLAGTRLPVSEVAARCGFESQSWFTTCFRRAFGATPSAYRRGVQ